MLAKIHFQCMIREIHCKLDGFLNRDSEHILGIRTTLLGLRWHERRERWKQVGDGDDRRALSECSRKEGKYGAK